MSNKENTPEESNKKSYVVMGLLGLVVVIAAAFGLYSLSQNGSSTTKSTTETPKPASVTLSMQTPTTQVSVGEVVPVAIRLNTAGKSVNGVEAEISYPAAQFDFVSIDASKSPFEVEAPSTGGNGTITVQRGAKVPVSGSDVLVATVNLRAKAASTEEVSVDYLATSQVVIPPSGSNVLQKTTGLKFEVE